jgi:3-mercaptopyruvate sulfurtransferase SseA
MIAGPLCELHTNRMAPTGSLACDRQRLRKASQEVPVMPRNPEDIRANREYFAAKLAAIKQRNDVLHAVDEKQVDFILLDTRQRDAFHQGHIPGAWCAPEAELEKVVAQLPPDREIVAYCWSHD